LIKKIGEKSWHWLIYLLATAAMSPTIKTAATKLIMTQINTADIK
jgi:hypothetical protein